MSGGVSEFFHWFSSVLGGGDRQEGKRAVVKIRTTDVGKFAYVTHQYQTRVRPEKGHFLVHMQILHRKKRLCEACRCPKTTPHATSVGKHEGGICTKDGPAPERPRFGIWWMFSPP